MKIGVVTGMQAEARLLRGMNCLVVAGGGNAESTTRKIEQLIADGATHLASFGIAGALDPSLGPGDLILADAVVLPDGMTVPTDGAWLARARVKLPAAGIRSVAGRSTAIARREDKSAAFLHSNAAAIDMESHHVAAAAQRHGLPFLVLRAVADTASDELPEAALVGLDKEGRPAIGAVLLSLLGNPAQLPALIRAALCSRRAMKALFRCRASLL